MEGNNDEEVLSAALAPLFSTFSFHQLEAVLYAYLPTRLQEHVPKTGIYAVDTFVITATVTIVLVAAKVVLALLSMAINRLKRRQDSEVAAKGDIAVAIDASSTEDEFHSSECVTWLPATLL